MRTLFTLLLCLGLLGGAGALVGLMAKFKPEAQKVERERLLPGVEVMTVQPADVTLTLPSQGLVQAMRSTVRDRTSRTRAATIRSPCRSKPTTSR